MSDEKTDARAAQAAATRAKLIEAATELFAEQGLTKPSLDAICERAGYTRGAFYVHFRDRDDFLVAVMDHVGERYLDGVLGTGEAGEDLGTIAGRFVQSVADGTYPLTGSVRPHQLLDACFRSDDIRARYVGLVRDTIGRVGAAVARAQEQGVVRRDVDPQRLGTLLLAAVIGAHTMMELGMEVDVGGSADMLVRLLGNSASA